MPDPRPSKTCTRCGRRFEWRKKWARNWDEVQYCSAACRRQRLTDTDRALEEVILQLLSTRKLGATICPSEAARAVGSEQTWRDRMEPARRAARRLVDRGEVEITQRGRVVEPSTARGPIRIRKL